MARIVGTALSELLRGGNKSDSIFGNGGDDTLLGGGGNDRIYGADGNDEIDGGDGNDVIYGNGGNDTFIGGLGNDTVYGGSGNDNFADGDGNDVVYGNGGNDTFTGGEGNDWLFGGSGNDTFFAADGNDVIVGNGGFDTYDASQLTTGVSINLGLGTAQGPGNQTVTGIEQVIGSDFADSIIGSAGDDVLSGGGGDDYIDGRAGNDVLTTGAGSDTLLGGDGDDRLIYDGATADGSTHVLDGGAGDDTVELRLTGAQYTPEVKAELHAYHIFMSDPANADATFTFTTLDNLQVGNVALFEASVDGVAAPTNEAPTIDLGASTAFMTVVAGNTAAGQVVAADPDGDAVSYAISGQAAHGQAAIDANGHFSYVAGQHMGLDSFTLVIDDGFGGTTEHTVNVGVWGELDVSGAADRMFVNLTADTATGLSSADVEWAINVRGSAFNDVVYGDAAANELRGEAGADQLNGAAGHDSLHGGDGNDGLWGGGGNDQLFGDAGDDVLIGDGGHDTLAGGAGSDILRGGQFNGGGLNFNDTFAWARDDVVNTDGSAAGFDRIVDFGAGDKLDFSGIFAGGPAVDAADVLRATDTAAGTLISADVGGGAFVDIVVLDNVHMSLDDLDAINAIVV